MAESRRTKLRELVEEILVAGMAREKASLVMGFCQR